MSAKEKIRCKTIVLKIQKGVYGTWNEENKEAIIQMVNVEYNLTETMRDYIVTLMDGENSK